VNIEEYRDFCLQKRGVTEGFPFDSNTLVFKVGGKMFALTNIDKFEFINLKCDPKRSIQLRETFNGIKPGWHMNKRLWNSVSVDLDVPEKLLLELITHSYDEVVKTLTKKLRDGL
jgi:predicted DNA-binding protein (MmcQ/YjbR family)